MSKTENPSYLITQGTGTILTGWGKKFFRYVISVTNPDVNKPESPAYIKNGTVVWYEHAPDGWKTVSDVEDLGHLEMLYIELMDDMQEKLKEKEVALLLLNQQEG